LVKFNFKITKDGGLEIIESSLPVVISTDLRLNEPRLPNLKSIMAAKKKKIDEMKLDDFGVDITPRLKIKKVQEPAERKSGIFVKDVQELVQKLKDEAKVL
jgi:electron transfer flavoprotein beta subunit